MLRPRRETRLFDALVTQDAEALRRVLFDGASPDTVFSRLWHGHPTLRMPMHQQLAFDGAPALRCLASTEPQSRHKTACLEILLAAGADPNRGGPLVNMTPLWSLLVRPNARGHDVALLLEAGARLDNPVYLHLAFRHGRADLVRMLQAEQCVVG